MEGLVKRDLRYIFEKVKLLAFLYLVIFIFLEIFFIINKNNNSIDIFFGFVYDQGYITNVSNIEIPVSRMMFQLIPTSILLLYIYTDHKENSSYIVLKSKSKIKYFLSKLSASLIYIIGINLILFLFVIANGLVLKNIDMSSLSNLIRLLAFYIISQFILLLMGFLIAIKFTYKFGIASVLVQLLLSMTTNYKWIVSQQTLAYKQDFLGGYINLSDNFMISIAYLLVLLLVGYFIFKRYNFYGGDSD